MRSANWDELSLSGTYSLLPMSRSAGSADDPADDPSNPAPTSGATATPWFTRWQRFGDDRPTNGNADARSAFSTPSWSTTVLALFSEAFVLAVDNRGRSGTPNMDRRGDETLRLALPGTGLSLSGGSIRIRNRSDTPYRSSTSLSLQFTY